MSVCQPALHAPAVKDTASMQLQMAVCHLWQERHSTKGYIGSKYDTLAQFADVLLDKR